PRAALSITSAMRFMRSTKAIGPPWCVIGAGDVIYSGRPEPPKKPEFLRQNGGEADRTAHRLPAPVGEGGPARRPGPQSPSLPHSPPPLPPAPASREEIEERRGPRTSCVVAAPRAWCGRVRSSKPVV